MQGSQWSEPKVGTKEHSVILTLLSSHQKHCLGLVYIAPSGDVEGRENKGWDEDAYFASYLIKLENV